MTDQDIVAALTEIFQDLFDEDVAVTPELTAKDVPGWDSIKHISLIVAVEDRFGIKLKGAEIETLSNVGDLIRIIRARTG